MRVRFSFGGDVEWLYFSEGERVTVSRVLEAASHVRAGLFPEGLRREELMRSSLPVFVNREHMRYKEGADTLVKDGDEVYVIPFLSGG